MNPDFVLHGPITIPTLSEAENLFKLCLEGNIKAANTVYRIIRFAPVPETVEQEKTMDYIRSSFIEIFG